uniref:PAN domain-containing protein, putative n=1 Tax=Neospora caninum (strain Liverpool) TaxID=572307 RepID=A0A0F7UQW1_NEOCL|nr:TPA: PAN domain-containing protein, putative [Neospora caninum Liverpool]
MERRQRGEARKQADASVSGESGHEADDEESAEHVVGRARSVKRERATRDWKDGKGRNTRGSSPRKRRPKDLSEDSTSDSDTRSATEEYDATASKRGRGSSRRPLTASDVDDGDSESEAVGTRDEDVRRWWRSRGASEAALRDSVADRRKQRRRLTGRLRSKRGETGTRSPFHTARPPASQADRLKQRSASNRPNSVRLAALIQAGAAAVRAADMVAAKSKGEAQTSTQAGPGTAEGRPHLDRKDSAALSAERRQALETAAALLQVLPTGAATASARDAEGDRGGAWPGAAVSSVGWEELATSLTASHLREKGLTLERGHSSESPLLRQRGHPMLPTYDGDDALSRSTPDEDSVARESQDNRGHWASTRHGRRHGSLEEVVRNPNVKSFFRDGQRFGAYELHTPDDASYDEELASDSRTGTARRHRPRARPRNAGKTRRGREGSSTDGEQSTTGPLSRRRRRFSQGVSQSEEDSWTREESPSWREASADGPANLYGSHAGGRRAQRRRLERQRRSNSVSGGEDWDERYDKEDRGRTDAQKTEGGVELLDDEELSDDIETLQSTLQKQRERGDAERKAAQVRPGEPSNAKASSGKPVELQDDTRLPASGENWGDGWEKVSANEAAETPSDVQRWPLLHGAHEGDSGWLQTEADPGDWKRLIIEAMKSGNVSGDVPLKHWLPTRSWQEFSGMMTSLSDVVHGMQAKSTTPESFGAVWMAKKEEKPLLQMDDSCFERNVRYSPGSEFLVVWRGVPTATHCQALCKLATPECHFFTFIRSALLPLHHQGACYLLPRKTPAVRVPSRGVFEVISGARTCSTPTPDAPPVDLVAVTSKTGCPSSPSICDSLNLPYPLGSRFSPFCSNTRDGHCANLANGVPCCTTCNDYPGNPCPEKTCYEYNVDYTDGTELRYIGAGVESRGACESLCRQTEGCTHYSYFSTPQLPQHLRGSCSLREFRLAPRNRVTVEGMEIAGDGHSSPMRSLVIFAPLFCEFPQTTTTTTTTSAPPPREPACIRENTDFWGHDLASFKGCASAAACKQICQSVDGCVAFTYAAMTKKCYLKWSAAVEKHVEGHESGPRCCDAAPDSSIAGGDGADSPACPPPREAACVFAGRDYLGRDIASRKGPVSAYKCYQLCKAEPRCDVWTHLPAEKLCFLKKADVPKHLTASEKRLRLQEDFVLAAGAITGFADCEPFYGPDATKFTAPAAPAKAEALRATAGPRRSEDPEDESPQRESEEGKRNKTSKNSRARQAGMSEDEKSSRRRDLEESSESADAARRRQLKRTVRPQNMDSEEDETRPVRARRAGRKVF